jgi:hypothetical protein
MKCILMRSTPNFIIKTPLVLLLLWAMSVDVVAQNPHFEQTAISKLKNGAVIVRIYANRPKTALLKKSIEHPDTPPEEKKKLEKMLKSHLNEVASYTKNIIKGYDAYFKFCPIYYTYDYNTEAIIQGKLKGIFLNKEGEVDTTIELSSDKYFGVLVRGDSPQVFILKDNALMPVSDNMPDRYNKNFWQGLKTLLGGGDIIADYANGFSKKLQQYYDEKKTE